MWMYVRVSSTPLGKCQTIHQRILETHSMVRYRAEIRDFQRIIWKINSLSLTHSEADLIVEISHDISLFFSYFPISCALYKPGNRCGKPVASIFGWNLSTRPLPRTMIMFYTTRLKLSLGWWWQCDKVDLDLICPSRHTQNFSFLSLFFVLLQGTLLFIAHNSTLFTSRCHPNCCWWLTWPFRKLMTHYASSADSQRTQECFSIRNKIRKGTFPRLFFFSFWSRHHTESCTLRVGFRYYFTNEARSAKANYNASQCLRLISTVGRE